MKKKHTIDTDTCFLNIGGFCLSIDFYNVEDEELRAQLKKFIVDYYKTTLINDPSLYTVQYEIHFVAEQQLKLLKNSKTSRGGREFFMRTYTVGKKSAYVDYHVSIVQFQFLLKIITQDLLEREHGFLLHCSGVHDGKQLYLFLGVNGAGKSTIMGNLRREYTAFADDVVVVRYVNREWRAFQFPLGKNEVPYVQDLSFPVKALLDIKKSARTHITLIPTAHMIQIMSRQVMALYLTHINIQDIMCFLSSVLLYGVLECQKKPDVKKIKIFLAKGRGAD